MSKEKNVSPAYFTSTAPTSMTPVVYKPIPTKQSSQSAYTSTEAAPTVAMSDPTEDHISHKVSHHTEKDTDQPPDHERHHLDDLLAALSTADLTGFQLGADAYSPDPPLIPPPRRSLDGQTRKRRSKDGAQDRASISRRGFLAGVAGLAGLAVVDILVGPRLPVLDVLPPRSSGNENGGSSHDKTSTSEQEKSGVVVDLPKDAGHINVLDYKGQYEIDPTGKKDCTKAIQEMMSTTLGRANGMPSYLYFPEGTYRISDTLYSKTTSGEWSDSLIFQGEKEGKTIIKMKDGIWNDGSGFTRKSDNTTKVMLYTASGGGQDGTGNNAFNNYVNGITFDLGDNKDGACLGFIANNFGGIRNCEFLCDNGYMPVDFGRAWEGPCIVTDTYFGGNFQNACMTNGGQYSMIMERVTAEACLDGNSFINSIPLAIKDSVFDGKFKIVASSTNTIFINTEVEVDNSANGIVQYLGPGNKDYKLIPKDTPTVQFETDMSEWVNVATYPGGIQEAFNSGKSVMYFPVESAVEIEGPITIPSSVKRIYCMGAGPVPKEWDMSKPLFVTEEGDSDDPFIFEQGYSQPAAPTGEDQNDMTYLLHKSKRPVAFKDWGGFGIINGVEGCGDIFLDNAFMRVILGKDVKLYARQWNWEDPFRPALVNNGGEAWIFGLKTEFNAPNGYNGPWPYPNYVPTITGRNGGRTELLLGFGLPTSGVPGNLVQYDFTDQDFVVEYYDGQLNSTLQFGANVASSPGYTRLTQSPPYPAGRLDSSTAASGIPVRECV